MEFMQLEMFVATVEEGSFKNAAQRVYRTQPSVSIAIRKLEQEIGAPLFVRSHRHSYRLTEKGRQLYDFAKRLLRLRDEMIATLTGTDAQPSGRIRIGANESTNLYVLPKLIRTFSGRHPQVKVEIFRQLSAKLPEDLREGTIDFAILSWRPDETEFEAVPVMRDDFVLIVSPQHPLAERRCVHIRDLGGESFTAYNDRSPSWEKVFEAFSRFRTPLNIGIATTSLETIKKLVALNQGVSFVPLMCVQEELKHGALVVVPVEGFCSERTLWLLYRDQPAYAPASQAFIQFLTPFGD